MTENEEKLKELQEEIMKLKYEIEEKTSNLLTLKKENERLYQDVKEARYQAALFRTELQNELKSYEDELALKIKEKNAVQEKFDMASIKVKKFDELEKTVSEIKINALQESQKLMDEAEEMSMDAVTVVEFIQKDISRMKYDLENLSNDESRSQDTLDEEIQLMIDLLNKHSQYLGSIKSGFYRINKITEYENAPEDFSIAHKPPKIVDGTYVD